MGLTTWISENWFTFLQSVGIVGSLWYAAQSFRLDARVRRIGNLFQIIDHHRQIWSQLYRQPELARVRESSPDLAKKPITVQEELFVTHVIFHLSAVFEASRLQVIEPFEGMEEDLRAFFSKPIPSMVWDERKSFQNRLFRESIDQILLDRPIGKARKE